MPPRGGRPDPGTSCLPAARALIAPGDDRRTAVPSPKEEPGMMPHPHVAYLLSELHRQDLLEHARRARSPKQHRAAGAAEPLPDSERGRTWSTQLRAAGRLAGLVVVLVAGAR